MPSAEVTGEYQEGLSHAYDSDESIAQARDNILTATALSDNVKKQVLADSGSSGQKARMEWPLRGIAADISSATRLIDVPTLVVAGARDVAEPVDVLRNNLLPYLSGAQLLVIPRTGHLIPLEAPEELAVAIDEFIRASGSGRERVSSQT